MNLKSVPWPRLCVAMLQKCAMASALRGHAPKVCHGLGVAWPCSKSVPWPRLCVAMLQKCAMASALRGHVSHHTPYNLCVPPPSTYPAKRRKVHHDIPGQARLLTFSCYKRRPLIEQLDAWRFVTDGIERSRIKHGFQLLAYIIMPEHVHLMILPSHDAPTVSNILTTLKQSSTRRAVAIAERSHPRTLESMVDSQPNGTSSRRLWQRGGGHDRNLWKPDRIWNAIEYLHANPVRRKLVARATDWHWSSAAAFRNGKTEPLRVDLDSVPQIVQSR